MRGQYQQATADLREVRRAMGDRAGLQFTQPTRYITALIALGQGDVAAARAAVVPGLTSDQLSAKTVSVHVSNILAKLGAGGRVEAAALIHRLGQAD